MDHSNMLQTRQQQRLATGSRLITVAMVICEPRGDATVNVMRNLLQQGERLAQSFLQDEIKLSSTRDCGCADDSAVRAAETV